MSGTTVRAVFPQPPRVLRTPRLVLRAYEAEHAPMLQEAVSASMPALREWTPWVIPDPFEVATLEARLAGFREMFEQCVTFAYAVLDADERLLLGHSGLFGRVGADALEVGYFIRTDMTGNGYATEAARALTDAAFRDCGVARVEMHCDALNVASVAVPLRLGFRETGRRSEGDRTILVLARHRAEGAPGS